jgi:hypothetical protein
VVKAHAVRGIGSYKKRKRNRHTAVRRQSAIVPRKSRKEDFMGWGLEFKH